MLIYFLPTVLLASVEGLSGLLGRKSGGKGGFGVSNTKKTKKQLAPYLEDTSFETQRFLEFLEREECEGIGASTIGFHRDSNLRGVFSKECFEQGEFIVAIPFVSTLLIDETFGNDNDTSDTQMGLQLLTKYLSCKDDTKWKPYLNCLPTRESHFSATPDFWEDDAIEALQIPPLIQESVQRKRDIHDLCQHNPGISAPDLQFATWLVRSRAFTTFKAVVSNDVSGETSIRTRSVFIPYMDFINHASSALATNNAEIQVIETAADDESFFALIATRPIAAGDEILLSYGTGRETSLDLVSRYGFYTEDNPNDANLDLSKCPVVWSTTLEEDETLLKQLATTCGAATKDALELRAHVKRIAKRNNDRGK